MEKKSMRSSLAWKLNVVIITAVLVAVMGLILASGNIYTLTIQNVFSAEADKILNRVMLNMDPEEIWNLKRAVETDEYRALREEATEKNDVRILQTWLRHQPSLFTDDLQFDEESPNESLYSDYLELYSYLNYTKRYSACERIFLMYEENNEKHVLADSDTQALGIGTVDNSGLSLEEFSRTDLQRGVFYDEDNVWYYFKCSYIMHSREDGKTVPVCICGVVFNVDTIIRGRSRFLLYSVLIAVGLISLVLLVSTLILRRLVVNPLKKLAEGAVRFGKGERGLSKDDIISLNIRTDDEIGDLYSEIQSMQERILGYTDYLTRITAERERVGTELRMAATIQKTMLPQDHEEFCTRPEFDLAAGMDPAKEVAGDFYDYFMIDDDHLAVVIADVSEKGVPASLFMMASKLLIDYRAKLGGNPSDILRDVNNEVYDHNVLKMFVTVWLGILDLSTGRMICSNAGHEYPEVKGEDGLFHRYKDDHGLVVGIRPGMTYTDYELVLKPGDAVFVYTDGVTDSKNKEGTFYGDERIELVLNEKPRETAEEIVNAIREDMNRFVDGAEQYDDITMLCLIYHGKNGTDA